MDGLLITETNVYHRLWMAGLSVWMKLERVVVAPEVDSAPVGHVGVAEAVLELPEAEVGALL